MNAWQNEDIDVVVVGGGPAGLAAAIAAARDGARTVLFEARDAPGHTIRPTGDGRCNIANAGANAWDYRNREFVRRVFVACKPAAAVAFLESCGLMLREEAQGRLYPQANKSTSVIEALLAAARRAGVETVGRRQVRAVRRNAGTWTVAFADGTRVRSHTVVVATGGRGQDDLLPGAVEQLPFEPVLGPLACDPDPLRGLDKIRAKCALISGDAREEGEALFRTFGVSGICAFNMSRLAKPGDELAVDFAPELAPGAEEGFLEARLQTLGAASWGEFCTGMLLPQVAHAVLRAAGLRDDEAPAAGGLAPFAKAWRAFPLRVRGVADPGRCQVHRGGVAAEALDPHTMEAHAAPGLFCAGEAVDVDGPCGGYNLHWAWASGLVAGRAAAEASLEAEGPIGKHGAPRGKRR